MTKDFNVSVSMNQAAPVKTGVVLKQGDFGFNLKITVLDFTVTGTTPQIVFRKSEGSVESTDVTASGNVYTYTFKGTELDTPGKVFCDLKLKNSTTQRISTASFQFECIADTLDGLTEEANSYSDTIAQLINPINDSISELNKNYNKISNDLNQTVWADNDFVDLSQITISDGEYISSDGSVLENISMSYTTDYIPINPGWESVIVNAIITADSGTDYPQTRLVAFYDAEKNFLTLKIGTRVGDLLKTTINHEYKYMRVNLSKNHRPQFIAICKTNAIRFLKAQENGETLSSLTESGVYVIGTDYTDAPINKAGLLISAKSPWNAVLQIYVIIGTAPGSRNTAAWARTCTNDGTWNPWTPITGLRGYGIQLQDANITDLNNAPSNFVYLISNSSNIEHLPATNWNGTIIDLHGKNNKESGEFQLGLSPNNELYLRRSWGVNASWSEWVRYVSLEETKNQVKKNLLGFVGEYNGQFTSGRQVISTQITLKAGKTYWIEIIEKPEKNVNFYCLGDENNYKTVSYEKEILITNNTEINRYLNAYNYDEGIGNLKLKVYDFDSITKASEDVPKKYIVCKNAREGDYTSLTQCLLDLKDDRSPKIIEILGGEYDIFQEYKDANVPVYTGNNPSTEYYDYNVWIPENTHIIGKGIVRLKWMPDPEENPEITWMQCYAVSPVNMAKTATIENVEIHCKNGRYCIHNDPYIEPDISGAIHKYINVKCYKYECDHDTTTTPGEDHIYGTHHCIGFGVSREMHHQYENCVFINYWDGRAFYGHTNGKYNGANLTEVESGDFTLNNCIFETEGNECIKFGNTSNTALHTRVMFSNCSFNKRINAINEGSGSPVHNAFDITFLNCGDVSLYISDPNNEYTPKAYRTNLTILNS